MSPLPITMLKLHRKINRNIACKRNFRKRLKPAYLYTHFQLILGLLRVVVSAFPTQYSVLQVLP